MSIKTVIFAPNAAGITPMDIDNDSWIIRSTCAALPHLYGRQCRLTKQGKRLEYWDGTNYREIQADIKMIN